MARARPADAASCAFDTMTGAACARLVVKTAAADASRSLTISARSRPLFLMPQATPVARKPAGAVTAPPIGAMVRSATFTREPARVRPLRRASPFGERVNESDARAVSARRLVNDERSHFGDRRAQRRQLGTPNQSSIVDGDEEPLRMRVHVVHRPREQMARGDIR